MTLDLSRKLRTRKLTQTIHRDEVPSGKRLVSMREKLTGSAPLAGSPIVSQPYAAFLATESKPSYKSTSYACVQTYKETSSVLNPARGLTSITNEVKVWMDGEKERGCGKLYVC